jgi:hypothetical protein
MADTQQLPPINPDEQAALDDVFSYHAPKDDQIPRYNLLREGAKAFATLIVQTVPSSADRTAALRKVREAVMTANAAIALEGRGLR